MAIFYRHRFCQTFSTLFFPQVSYKRIIHIALRLMDYTCAKMEKSINRDKFFTKRSIKIINRRKRQSIPTTIIHERINFWPADLHFLNYYYWKIPWNNIILTTFVIIFDNALTLLFCTSPPFHDVDEFRWLLSFRNIIIFPLRNSWNIHGHEALYSTRWYKIIRTRAVFAIGETQLKIYPRVYSCIIDQS